MKHAYKTDMSGANLSNKDNSKPFKVASDYVPQPGNSYGKGRSGLQPSKARRQSYTPDSTPYQGGNG